MRAAALVIAAIACTAAPSARAQPATDAKTRANAAFAAGETAYKAGQFLDAAAQFKAAYDLDPDPGYLFNIAQAYRFAGDCVSAADYYRQFLTEIPDPPNADKIRGWADETAECAKAKTAAGASVESETGSPTGPVLVDTPTPAPARRGGHRTLAVVALAGGAVALGVAGFFTWDASFLERQHD